MFERISTKIQGLVSLVWREVAKFGVVGGAAFVVDSAIYLWMLSGPMSDSPVKAKIVAGVVATLFSWVANRYWTFRHRRQANVARELVMFLVMNAIGLGIAAACVWVTKYILLLTDTTSVFIAGSVVGLVLGTIFRFFAYRFWVFGDRNIAPQLRPEPELVLATGSLTQVSGDAGDIFDAGSRRPDTDSMPRV
ncbi:GtrA family protein [Glutamicibacter sp. MNS18]|uniref:GtrA family protein n=1 Tax=Glutamicibacter sp. MNS18 TaxID=2989817 RepID=UPI0022369821|nr:GtrA family protein [Glutamicibacter sp. MNS18]MCW4465098.1 GtrA family protein [Glutamicibacter sp. MNS18]